MAKGKIPGAAEYSAQLKEIPETYFDSYLYKNRRLVIEFSPRSAFYSVGIGDFSNFLFDGNDFIEHFREVMDNISALSGRTLDSLMSDGGFRHCHKTDKDGAVRAAVRAIYRQNGFSDATFEQELGGETIYQLGYFGSVRLFGTHQGNIFRVYLVDYHHDIERDDRFNERGHSTHKFCAMTSDL